MSQKSNPAPSILAEAAEVVTARGKRYGSPFENHNRTAQLWGAYLGIELSAADVCKLNILQKLSRDRHQQNRDNLVDVAGYVENALLSEPGSYGQARADDEDDAPEGFYAEGAPKTVDNCFAAGPVPFDDVRQQIRRTVEELAKMRDADGGALNEPIRGRQPRKRRSR